MILNVNVEICHHNLKVPHDMCLTTSCGGFPRLDHDILCLFSLYMLDALFSVGGGVNEASVGQRLSDEVLNYTSSAG